MNYTTLKNARISAAKHGLKGKIGKFNIIDVANQMLDISYQGLKRRNFLDKNGISETQFLDPLFNLVERKETAAEEIIRKYNLQWNKKIEKIFDKEIF